ncbi:MAG TPA: hypothetical protein VFV96_10510 [Verrucomicrobiae bacterium]|nr:hypothetical protein [Verrucomicrobiae bacterium]
MTNTFDKLNLRPFERRLVVGVGIVLFVVVQFLYVWPHFGDVETMGLRREKALKELKVRNDEIAQTNKFAVELAKLQGQGADVPREDQAVELLRAIQSQAAQTGVSITANSKPVTRTNDAFFIEQSQQITTVSTEGALIDFLYNLGTGNSLIRVRDLTLRPDPSHTKLTATIKLVANYQKSPAGRAATPVIRPAPRTAPKPAAPPALPPQPSTATRKKP